jgi:hypothetical protein
LEDEALKLNGVVIVVQAQVEQAQNGRRLLRADIRVTL